MFPCSCCGEKRREERVEYCTNSYSLLLIDVVRAEL